MNKKKMIITSACGSLVIGLSAFAGYEYGKQQTFQTTSLVQNTAQAKKINYSDKVSSVVVSEITDDGYVTLHGDHSHFEKGLVPYNAKILDSLVYKNKDYKLKDEDIKMMRDIAERQYVVDYQVLTPQVSVHYESNNSATEQDINDLVGKVEEKIFNLVNSDLGYA